MIFKSISAKFLLWLPKHNHCGEFHKPFVMLTHNKIGQFSNLYRPNFYLQLGGLNTNTVGNFISLLSCFRIARYNDFQIYTSQIFTFKIGGLSTTTVPKFYKPFVIVIDAFAFKHRMVVSINFKCTQTKFTWNFVGLNTTTVSNFYKPLSSSWMLMHSRTKCLSVAISNKHHSNFYLQLWWPQHDHCG
jgi:hypothetical protein